MLDTHQRQNIFGVPCPAQPGAMVLRTQLRSTQTYASYIDQPCMHLIFALSAATSLVVMRADCTNACATAPSPSPLTRIRIDDAYADWYRSDAILHLRLGATVVAEMRYLYVNVPAYHAMCLPQCETRRVNQM
jgi:hypothetical protein